MFPFSQSDMLFMAAYMMSATIVISEKPNGKVIHKVSGVVRTLFQPGNRKHLNTSLNCDSFNVGSLTI